MKPGLLPLLPVLCALTACDHAAQAQDLRQWIAQQRQQAKPVLTPLPPTEAVAPLAPRPRPMHDPFHAEAPAKPQPARR